MDLALRNKVFELLVPGQEITIFDMISTGDGENDRILQFSGIHGVLKSDYKIEEKEFLDLEINPETGDDTTGLTEDTFGIASHPYEKDVYGAIEEFLNYGMLTGYNVGYDLRMMRGAARRNGKEFLREADFDILNLARNAISKPDEVENHNLQTVYHAVCNKMYDTESTIQSTRAAMAVLEDIIQRCAWYVPQNATDVKMIKARFSYNVLTKSSQKILFTLNVGKEGVVWYDVDNDKWNIMPDFKDIVFIPEIERQFEAMYLKPMQVANIQEMADIWFNSIESLSNKPKKTAKKK